MVFLTVARQNWFKLVKLIQSVIASYFAISDFLFGIPYTLARENRLKLVKLILSVIASYFAISDFLFGIPHFC